MLALSGENRTDRHSCLLNTMPQNRNGTQRLLLHDNGIHLVSSGEQERRCGSPKTSDCPQHPPLDAAARMETIPTCRKNTRAAQQLVLQAAARDFWII